MGIISIITANPLMGIAVIATTAYAYKNKKINTEDAIKGAGQAGISLAIFNLLGLPILIELFIVINVFSNSIYSSSILIWNAYGCLFINCI